MVEVWLRYGKTMIFTDIEENFEIVKNSKTWTESQKLREEISNTVKSGINRIVIDYVYGVERFDEVIETAVSAVGEKLSSSDRLEVFVSCWRYGDLVEKVLFDIAKNTIYETGVEKIKHLTSSEVDLSAALVISPSIYWDGEVVCWRDFCDFMGTNGGYVVSPVVGYCGVVSEVLFGEKLDEHETVAITNQAASYTTADNPDIILVGGPGHPIDARLSTCINLAAAVADTSPNKVVVYAFECSEGLGDNEFIKTLIGTASSPTFEKRVAAWRNTASKHKVCVVTALPATFVEELLHAKHSDTLDQALVYGRRIKTREAKVLVVENGVGTRLTGF
ncbi:MAG: hypothetical protein QXH12_05780 [Candidatus Caldarchaeum sp.]